MMVRVIGVLGLLVMSVFLFKFFSGQEAMITGIVENVRIAELRRNAESYDNRTVQLHGHVGERVTLAGVGGFTLADGSRNEDRMIVFITGQTPPAIGDELLVTGRFRMTWAVAETVGVVLVDASWTEP